MSFNNLKSGYNMCQLFLSTYLLVSMQLCSLQSLESLRLASLCTIMLKNYVFLLSVKDQLLGITKLVTSCGILSVLVHYYLRLVISVGLTFSHSEIKAELQMLLHWFSQSLLSYFPMICILIKRNYKIFVKHNIRKIDL